MLTDQDATPISQDGAADDGFTLIELVLTVALLGIIMSAIVGSFLVMLDTKESTSESLDASRDQQFLTTYFNDDVASAQAYKPLAGAATPCDALPGTLVRLQGQDVQPGTTSTTVTLVAYTYEGTSLVRSSCRGAAAADRRVLARDVPSAPTVSASCSSTLPLAPDSQAREVRLTVPSTSGTSTSLCGKRRVT